METGFLREFPLALFFLKNDRLAGKAMSMAAVFGKCKQSLRFCYCGWENSGRGIEKREFYAVMKIPEGLVESIMDGTNLPVRVVFPGKASVEGRIFRELTEAGAATLAQLRQEFTPGIR